MMTYDVFTQGGEYGWLSCGRAQSSEQAAELTGAPVELRSETVHSYQDSVPLARRSYDLEATHESMVIRGTKCMDDAVATLDGMVKGVRIFGYFPAKELKR